MATKKDYSIIQSLDKGLYLLEVIEQAGEPIGLNALWRRLQWDKATIHRLLSTLEKRGYVHRDPQRKTYTLGLKIHALHSSLLRELDLHGITRPHLVELTATTGQTAHLAVVVEKSVVFIDRVTGSDVISVNTQIGAREPLHCTALGKAFLAAHPAEDLADLVEPVLEKYTSRTITSLETLTQELNKTQKRGYAMDDQEYIEGVRCLAAAVLNQYGTPVAMVGISGPVSRMPLAQCRAYGALVHDAALAVSQRFGYSPGT